MKMKTVRIEVIKQYYDPAFAARYGCEGLGPCEAHRVGDVWYTDHEKPDGLCHEAWRAIGHYVFALAHGIDRFFDGAWTRDDRTAICSCNDGLRPVVFKLEVVDEA